MTEAGNRVYGSRVAGYVRSALRGDPKLNEQVSAIRAYAERHGLYLAEVIRDEGTSAVAAWRPMVDRLVEDLACGRYVGVIILSLEQLGRPRSAALRTLMRLRATSAWVAFLDNRGVPDDGQVR